jgi:hypothetical protein
MVVRYGMVWYMSSSAGMTSPSYPCSISSALIALAIACSQVMGGFPILSLFLSNFSATLYKNTHTLVLHNNRLQITSPFEWCMSQTCAIMGTYPHLLCTNFVILAKTKRGLKWTNQRAAFQCSFGDSKGDWNGPISVQHFAVTDYVSGACIFCLQFHISTDI